MCSRTGTSVAEQRSTAHGAASIRSSSSLHQRGRLVQIHGVPTLRQPAMARAIIRPDPALTGGMRVLRLYCLYTAVCPLNMCTVV